MGANTYGQALIEALERSQYSRRRLSAVIAERTGNKQESEYRALGKYLRGDEIPEQHRASVLAELLGEPQLALVPTSAQRRRGRLGELEAEVARLREILVVAGEAHDVLVRRVAALEKAAATPARGRRRGAG